MEIIKYGSYNNRYKKFHIKCQICETEFIANDKECKVVDLNHTFVVRVKCPLCNSDDTYETGKFSGDVTYVDETYTEGKLVEVTEKSKQEVIKKYSIAPNGKIINLLKPSKRMKD